MSAGGRLPQVVEGGVVLTQKEVEIATHVLNALNGQVMLQNESVTVAPAMLRHGAHRVADAIFEKLTGVRGAFATRIAYISVTGTPPAQRGPPEAGRLRSSSAWPLLERPQSTFVCCGPARRPRSELRCRHHPDRMMRGGPHRWFDAIDCKAVPASTKERDERAH